MELPEFGQLISGLFIGAVGLAMFIYGKKRPEPKCLGIGLAMCIYPYFVHSMVIMWGIAALCVAGAYVLPRLE
jgi:hypothetical protein